MKATDFTEFFEFSISRIEEKEVPFDDDCFVYALQNSDKYYAVSDNQCTFRTRYIDNVSDLVECFDSMLDDYINMNIEEDGFSCCENDDRTYYEQALEWLENNDDYKNTWTFDVVNCLVNPELIEDNVERG